MAFDLASAKPFEAPESTGSFDLSTAQPISANAAKEMSWGEVGKGAVSRAIPSTVELIKGVAHAVTNPKETGQGIADLLRGALFKVLPEEWHGKHITDEDVQRAVATADAVGGAYKARYGTMEGLKKTLATDPAGAAADLSMILSGGAGVAGKAGTVGKMLDTAATITNPLTVPLKAVGLAGDMTAFSARHMSDVFNPKAAAYMKATEGQAPAVVAALRAPNLEVVPGSLPTAAEAASPLGLTQLSALEREVRGTRATQFDQRAGANADARRAAIDTVAKDQTALDAAKAVREQNATANYRAVDPQLLTSDPALESLMQTPVMRAAFGRAAGLAANDVNRGMPFQVGQNAPAQTIPSNILNAAGQPISATTIPAQFAQFPVKSLHDVKTALDDVIKSPATFGIGASEARAAGTLRNQLINWIEDPARAPGYGVARQTYAADSVPINQIEVGQVLRNKLLPAADETAAQSSTNYANALRDAPATIKRGTGQARYESLDQIFTPGQIDTLESIRTDLARKAESERLGAQGSKSGAIAPSPAPTAPHFLSKVVTLANTIMQKLQGRIDHKLALQIAEEMLNPQAAASAIEGAAARQQRFNQRGAAVSAVPTAVLNALRSPAGVGLGRFGENKNNLN